MVLSEATKEVVHLRSFLIELGSPIPKVKMLSDNRGAILLEIRCSTTDRSTSMCDITLYASYSKKIIEVEHISTEDMTTDVFMKGLSRT